MTALGRWLRDHPRYLETPFDITHRLFNWLDPLIARLGYKRVDRWLHGPEAWAKKAVFDCRMCGQCILHSTGMTCPMSCPKELRNGPCGGVRTNGHCEVKPEMRCVWVEAFERSGSMAKYSGEIIWIQPPVNRQLQGTSAWINTLTGEADAVPEGWNGTSRMPLIRRRSQADKIRHEHLNLPEPIGT